MSVPHKLTNKRESHMNLFKLQKLKEKRGKLKFFVKISLILVNKYAMDIFLFNKVIVLKNMELQYVMKIFY